MIINLSSLTNKGKFNLKWQGEYCFGETWIAFRGMSAENNLHAHAALQLVAGAGITVTDDNTFEKQGNGWLIPSGVNHRITTSSPIVILLIEPDSFFADALQPSQQKGLIVQSLSLEMLDTLLADIPLRDMMNKLETLYHQNNSVIDARLISAMTYLNSIDKRPTVELIGKHVGLSVSRLRALSTHYLGVPFSKIIVWKQVNLAFQSLAKGASLADAAYDAGFADQAHFTRILRDTIGVTPGQTQNMDKQ